MEKVNLIECISTWQGEGPDNGKRMLLLRFKHCNRKCPYCDTLVKMRIQHEFEMSMYDIKEIMITNNAGIMITGGEPTFDPHFDDTVKILTSLPYSYANVETNGFKLQELIEKVPYEQNPNIKFIYSPKIFNIDDYDREIKTITNTIHDYRVIIKLVYENNKFINQFLDDLYEINLEERIFLMPKGVTREELLRNAPEVFDKAEYYKCNFSSRTHIMYDFV